MNKKDLDIIIAAVSYQRDNEFVGCATDSEEDQNINREIIKSFIEGFNHAKNSTKNPDNEG